MLILSHCDTCDPKTYQLALIYLGKLIILLLIVYIICLINHYIKFTTNIIIITFNRHTHMYDIIDIQSNKANKLIL